MCVCVCVCVQSFSHVQLFATPWTSSSAPLSMEFSRQESWSRLPFHTPGDLSNPGIEPMSLAYPSLIGGFFTTSPPGKPIYVCITESVCCLCETKHNIVTILQLKKRKKLSRFSFLPLYSRSDSSPIRSFPCSSQPSQGQQWRSKAHYLAWALCRASPSLGSLPPSGVSQHPISFSFSHHSSLAACPHAFSLLGS